MAAEISGAPASSSESDGPDAPAHELLTSMRASRDKQPVITDIAIQQLNQSLKNYRLGIAGLRERRAAQLAACSATQARTSQQRLEASPGATVQQQQDPHDNMPISLENLMVLRGVLTHDFMSNSSSNDLEDDALDAAKLLGIVP